MENQDWDGERNPFLSIPQKKIDDAVEDIKNVYLDNKSGKFSIQGSLLLDAIHRYAQSNIPADYWFREMDKFTGDKKLAAAYEDYRKDIKGAYKDGLSYCFAGAHGLGKMHDLETLLPTPNGFVKLKDLNEGDVLFDESGKPCNLIKLHPIDYSPKSYEVTFDSGEKIKACADHLWFTWTLKDRQSTHKAQNNIKRQNKRRQDGITHKPYLESTESPSPNPSVKTTQEIFETLYVNGKQRVPNHSIPNTKPLEYSEKSLPIHPYVLGCWLGDGSSYNPQITTADPEIINNINECGLNTYLISSTANKKAKNYKIGKYGEFLNLLNSTNLLKNKHIPEIYLRGSVEQRLELVQGLLDTDGSCSKDGLIEFCNTNKDIAEGFCELVLSLGIKTKVNKNESFLNDLKCKDRYRITFSTTLPVFKLDRKLKNQRLLKSQMRRTSHRYIISVEPTDPVPMRCITVDSQSHLYLITKSCIPTHNTMVTTCILKRAVETGKYTALYVNLVDIVNLMASSASSDRDDKSDAHKVLRTVDFLAIDEFDSRFMGTDNAADLFGRMLEPILRHRIQNKLPIIFCTNSPDPAASFTGPLKMSFTSLMKKVKTVYPLGKDHR